ncbi:protein adenylyltransferase SelO family protein [Sphingomonas lenta]|uniref:Protein nucleotidyltransferase YdiU n=1 Tax=Sphingomonas lenta TaxID=1141887 RepID=A0A2A2SC69_9SPHN|nr:YdiU family protein [Sphingomonas lenta]PAX06601.1 selenoprotein O [Sphingomonas lenta]
MPVSPQAYRPAAKLLDLGPDLWDPVRAADFPQTVLRYRNDRAAAEVGLSDLTDDEWLRHFGRFEPLPGTLPEPLALRYHGHQFRVYNPDIGDGRGFTFAQMHDASERLMDLGTKGSGQTPYSRFGDGRLTLKGGVREILATEMLEALNVPTSRTLSLIETGEALERGDEPSPTRSAVMVRLSHGHIRIGTFQRLAYYQDEANMRRLVDYVLRELYREEPGEEPALRLLDFVIDRTARLAARYMAAGFVHGVLNSDNINVIGESFDYGPWRFAPSWDVQFTAAYFDHAGLYAFGRQPEAIHWDLFQLAGSLRLLTESDPLIALLEQFGPRFQGYVAEALLWRLGLKPRGEAEDRALVQSLERALRDSGVELHRFFHDAFARPLPERYGEDWSEFRTLAAAYESRKRRGAFFDGEPCGMLIDEVEAIWAPIAETDDWSRLHAKVEQVRAMGEALR